MKKMYAFTMAEVLITLGIIGVVAAMTLPSLVNNNRNKALEAALKKSYSTISQALNMYYVENGEKISSENVGKNAQTLVPILKKYLNVIGQCERFGSYWGNLGCLRKNGTKFEKVTYKTYNGNTSVRADIFDDGNLILQDGSFLIVENGGSWNANRLFITVDVNGFRKNPNRLGQDLFMFQLDAKGNLLPMGAKGTTYYDENDEYCSATSTNNMNDAGCTIKAINEKDYFSKLK